MKCKLMLPTDSHIKQTLHNTGDGGREVVRRWFVQRDGFTSVLYFFFEDINAFFMRWSLLEFFPNCLASALVLVWLNFHVHNGSFSFHEIRLR